LEDGIDSLYTPLSPYCIRLSQYDVDDEVLVFLCSCVCVCVCVFVSR
jgi:hypothetical protein